MVPVLRFLPIRLPGCSFSGSLRRFVPVCFLSAVSFYRWRSSASFIIIENVEACWVRFRFGLALYFFRFFFFSFIITFFFFFLFGQARLLLTHIPPNRPPLAPMAPTIWTSLWAFSVLFLFCSSFGCSAVAFRLINICYTFLLLLPNRMWFWYFSWLIFSFGFSFFVFFPIFCLSIWSATLPFEMHSPVPINRSASCFLIKLRPTLSPHVGVLSSAVRGNYSTSRIIEMELLLCMPPSRGWKKK